MVQQSASAYAVNVHVDHLCEALRMKAQSPEKSTNVRDARYLTPASREHDHGRSGFCQRDVTDRITVTLETSC